jgi:hypothetical protein
MCPYRAQNEEADGEPDHDAESTGERASRLTSGQAPPSVGSRQADVTSSDPEGPAQVGLELRLGLAGAEGSPEAAKAARGPCCGSWRHSGVT